MRDHFAAQRELESTHILVDMQDFGCPYLNDEGVLAVSRDFDGPMLVGIGRDLLELSKVTFPVDGTSARKRESIAYIFRNLVFDEYFDATMLLDEQENTNEIPDIAGASQVTVHTGTSIKIGRLMTPQLMLSGEAGFHHLQFDFGDEGSYVYFTDLNTLAGTKVYLPQNDMGSVTRPNRQIMIDPTSGNQNYRTAIEQRWLR